MTLKLMGKKKRMTWMFDDEGNLVACTVILVEPNVIVQVKDCEKDSYKAVQLGAVKVAESKKRKVSKPLLFHFAAAKVEPVRHLFEFRVETLEGYEVGQEIAIDQFADCSYVDVIGTSKGKGFQGVIKRHNFGGGPASHGSGFHRSGGSTGMRSTPGRCLPKVKKPGRMGGKRVTVEGLEVMQVDAEKKVMLVKGAIPGHCESFVWVRKSIKKGNRKKR
ncbi:MAG: 50S ribosomal protein L3 [Chlamydiota bacterium]